MELFPGEFPEPEARKEIQVVREDENLFQPQGPGFLQTAFDQALANAPALFDRNDHQGPDFPQILPENMERGEAQNGPRAIFPVHEKIPDKAVEFREGTGQDVPFAGVFRQETVNFRDFIEPGFGNHGALT